MVVEYIKNVKVVKTSPKKSTGSVQLVIDYNDSSQVSVDVRSNSISDEVLIVLAAYYYIMDRLGYLDTFDRLIDECELLINHENYRMFLVQERLSNVSPYKYTYKGKMYAQLKDSINIDWEKIDSGRLRNFTVEYIDPEIP